MEKFIVKLRPQILEKQVGNLIVDRSLQDYVDIYTDAGQQTWGYLSNHPQSNGTWQPLSGFPIELVGEVQRQINEIRGTNAAPPAMLFSGRTAAEQDADVESDDEEDQEYE